jgi:hypothetical protein
MAKVPKLKYKINIDDLFGGRYKTNPATRAAIGQAIIDRIVERTQSENVDRFGKSLGTYSPSYRDSLDFKVLKGSERVVNLTATGDMLGSMTITEQTPRTITIGWTDSEQNTKAYGHISGMKGHPVLQGKVKPRDFFGLPKSDLEAIASEFEDQVIAVDRIESAETREQLDGAILDIIAELEGEIDGE